MTAPTDLARDRTRPVAFVLWGWALLLLVLLSAAPSGAQPCTRLVGSAFDPSTVSVTVAPATREDTASARKLRADDPDADPADLVPATLPVAHAVAAERQVMPLPILAVVPAQPANRALLRSQPTRAPPLG